jgi:hypothetical protein
MIKSLIFGIFFGLFYGLFFFSEKRRALLSENYNPGLVRTVLYTIVRFSIIILLFRILLLYGNINPILITVPFLVSFWFIIYISKV